MAKICAAMACCHSPYLYTQPEDWNEIRLRKPVREDVPWDSPEGNKAKFDRCMKAFAALKEKIEKIKPDVLLIVSNDQLENFDFGNYPAMAICLQEELEGQATTSGYLQRIMGKEFAPVKSWARVKGHPALGKELLIGLMKKGFDPAFMVELPNKDRGLAHGFLRPAYYLTPQYDIPILPFYLNCYYAPQPSGKRCYELGKAIREVVEESTLNLKVVVLGSGGLWHTPEIPDAYLDEDFDKAFLAHLSNGHARKLDEYFDSIPWPYSSAPPEIARKLINGIGISVGIGSGIGESRNWIVAAAVADGTKAEVLDYVPIYASPTGAAFAHWEL